jgi:uncharacterized protein (DUF362 family)
LTKTDFLGERSKLGNPVSLVRASNSKEEMQSLISKALSPLSFESNLKVRSVAIKPNLAYYWDASTGYTTDPRVVAGIIDYLRERYGDGIDIRIVEADATAMRTKPAFMMLGYKRLAEEKNVKLFNLSSDTRDEKKVWVNGREITFKVPRSLLTSDLFINVPKLKIMRVVRVSCALKNIFGCIASRRKIVYHPFLNEAIVGINKVLHPHLTIVDGLVALGRFPVRLDLIMASADPFSIDWIASKIMGYNPSRIKYLKLARKEKLGNPKGIVVLGEDPNMFKAMFPHQTFARASLRLWGIQLSLLRSYCRIVGDVIPPILEET